MRKEKASQFAVCVVAINLQQIWSQFQSSGIDIYMYIAHEKNLLTILVKEDEHQDPYPVRLFANPKAVIDCMKDIGSKRVMAHS